jgi:hypothetical protein
VLSYWIELGIRECETTAETPQPTILISPLNFLADIWVMMHMSIEDNDSIGNSILACISKVLKAANSNRAAKISCFALMFRLLLTFSDLKSNYAPILYKTLTFQLVENHADAAIREFMLTNFKAVIDRIKSIPVSVLVEPLVKRM